MSSRRYANRLILEVIAQQVESSPDLRFGQILVNLDIVQLRRSTYSPTDWDTHAVNPFNEESLVTLSRVEKREGVS